MKKDTFVYFHSIDKFQLDSDSFSSAFRAEKKNVFTYTMFDNL